MSFGEIAPKAGGGKKPLVSNSNTQDPVSQVNGINSIAAGPGAKAIALGSVAIGVNTMVISDKSIVIGENAKAINNSTYSVAIGYNSRTDNAYTGVALGSYASALATDTVAIGNSVYAQAAYGIAIGTSANAQSARGIAIGAQTNVYHAGSVVIGNGSRSDFTGEIVFSTGCWASYGDFKISLVPMRQVTTNATPLELTTGNGSPYSAVTATYIALSSDSMYMFDCDIIARNTGDDTQCACWNLKFGIRLGAAAANTVLVGTPVKTVFGQDTGTTTWDVSVSADVSNGRPKIEVTGEASKTIRWVSHVRMTKVSG